MASEIENKFEELTYDVPGDNCKTNQNDSLKYDFHKVRNVGTQFALKAFQYDCENILNMPVKVMYKQRTNNIEKEIKVEVDSKSEIEDDMKNKHIKDSIPDYEVLTCQDISSLQTRLELFKKVIFMHMRWTLVNISIKQKSLQGVRISEIISNLQLIISKLQDFLQTFQQIFKKLKHSTCRNLFQENARILQEYIYSIVHDYHLIRNSKQISFLNNEYANRNFETTLHLIRNLQNLPNFLQYLTSTIDTIFSNTSYFGLHLMESTEKMSEKIHINSPQLSDAAIYALQINVEDRKSFLFAIHQMSFLFSSLFYLVDQIFQAVEKNQSPKIFINNCKYILIDSFKVIYIADALQTGINHSMLRQQIFSLAYSFYDSIKVMVQKANAAMVNFPNLIAIKSMIDNISNLICIARNFHAVMIMCSCR